MLIMYHQNSTLPKHLQLSCRIFAAKYGNRPFLLWFAILILRLLSATCYVDSTVNLFRLETCIISTVVLTRAH